ncbi:antibiotic biosynthesis monooxygenase [Rhodococcus opacus]|nr:antibiotic biosynthesis monooxygenase [Rhodococcus opacus]
MSVVYRVDKFVVPDQAGEEFWSPVRRTHLVLRDQPGFVADSLLEQSAGPGRCNAVTMVQWQSAGAVEAAKPAVIDAHAAVSFDPVAFFDSVGISSDLGNYGDVAR